MDKEAQEEEDLDEDESRCTDFNGNVFNS